MTNQDLEAAITYRDQFKYGTAEFEALTGLIDLLIANDTFAYARHWRTHRDNDYEDAVSKSFETYAAECAESRAAQQEGDL